MNSPCFTCTRVRDPINCENKTCKDWQAWFLDRWESMREYVRSQMEKAPVSEIGVPLGGHHYISPHRMEKHLQTDPCSQCQCPRSICTTPCKAKDIWNNRQGKVHL